MAKWYCKNDSLIKMIVWNKTGTETMTYYSRFEMDKKSQRAGEDDLINRLYLESKDPRNWYTAITYDNQTKQELTRWVDKKRI